MRSVAFVACAALLAILAPAPARAQDPAVRPDAAPRPLSVTPSEAVAGTYQTLRLLLPVGNEGLGVGGGLRFELPVAYGETEFLFWSRPQTELPDGPGYVRAWSASGAPVRVRTFGVAGGVVEATAADRALPRGDTLHVEYRGVVQSLARELELRAETRPGGAEAWRPLEGATISIRPQAAATMLVLAPGDVARGEPFDVAVVLLDRFGNRASGYRGTVTLTAPDSTEGLPAAHAFGAADSGVHVFPGVRYRGSGFRRIGAADGRLSGRGNYTYVAEAPPRLRRFFGATHFHTGTGTRNRGFIAIPAEGDINTLDLRSFTGINLGGDHRGNLTTAEEAYRYVRDVVRLDFAASTEHDAQLFDSIAWRESQRISSGFYAPGRFTTFYGYEWTAPVGHHIVLYHEEGGEVFGHQEGGTLPELWGALDAQGKPALTIPHVTWPSEEHGIWEHRHDGYRRVGELYSLWNGRFLVQPNDDPQRFELGADNRWSYQYAWKQGHHIGVVGASDNHLGQPGANNYTIYTQHTGGLAAVLAERNDRPSIWGALQARRSYATTGTRIYLDVEVNGQPMGSELEAASPPTIRVRAGGTNRLQSVEVVKYDHAGYRTIHEVRPDGETAEFSVTDDDFHEDSFYYVRVRQVDEYPGRPFSITTGEMAWSSPVWVRKR